MGRKSPEEHAGRSAELQRLLDEADSRPGAAPGRTSLPTPKRSPLRSSPPTTFPRRSMPAGPAPAAGAADADGQRRADPAADPSARLRRSAMVRSSVDGAAARRRRAADPATEAGRSRQSATAAGTTTRGIGRTVAPSTRTAAARSLAGRWGASGFSPVLPEHGGLSGTRPGRDGQARRDDLAGRDDRFVPGNRAGDRALPDHQAEDRATGGAPFRPEDAGRRQPVTDPGVRSAPPAGRRPSQERSTALPPHRGSPQRRTVVLAGGVAAAVVAIVAIVSLGHGRGSSPAAGADATPDRVVMVQTTGADAAPTVATVTAPVSTVNGRVVAMVPDANGVLQQLTVVTAVPPAVTRTSPPATVRSTAAATSRPAAGAGTGSQPGSTRSPQPTTGTAAGSTSAPATTAGPVPADPGDVATVVTGLTTLTGWEPVPTG